MSRLLALPMIALLATGLLAQCSTRAIPPTIPVSVFGDTSGTELNQAYPPCGGDADDEVWTYEAPCTATYTVSLCNAATSFDTVLAVYDQDPCAPLVAPIACNDDSCGPQSELTGLSFTGGTTYYIVVDGATTGAYQLDLTSSGCPPAPCLEATIPPMVPVVVRGDTGTSGLDQVTPGCGGGTSDQVWEYVVPATGTYTFSLCTAGTSFDTVLEIFDGDPCTTGLSLGCSDNACGLQSEVTLALVEGVTVHVVVDGAGGATGPYELQVTCSNCPAWTVTAPPCVAPGGSIDLVLQADSLAFQQATAQWNLTWDAGAFALDPGFGTGGVQYGTGWVGSSNEPSPGRLLAALYHLPIYPTGVDTNATVRMSQVGGTGTQLLTLDLEHWTDPTLTPIRGAHTLPPARVNVGCAGGPVCAITAPAGGSTLSEQATVTFATGHPTLTPLTITYEVDAGSGFQPATRVGGGGAVDTGVLPGPGLTFDWHVAADVPASTPVVTFRVTVDDLGGGVSSCTELFDVFVNTPATCVITSPAPGTSLSVQHTMTFDLVDPDLDPVTVWYEFDAGSGFQPPTRLGGGSPEDPGLSPAAGLTFDWDISADFPGSATGVVFRIVTDDGSGVLRSCSETYDIHVNTSASCAIADPAPGATLVVSQIMTFDALDIDADPLTITYEYNAGGGFLPCTRLGGGSSVDVGVTPGPGLTFDWDVETDVTVTTPGVAFRLTVDDLLGTPAVCTETYDVFVNIPPTCVLVNPSPGFTVTSTMPVQFGTNDAEGHLLDIYYEYDAGGGFQPATRDGGGAPFDLGVSPGAFEFFIWDARADLIGAIPGVIFQVRLDDRHGGTGLCSVQVDVDLPTCPPPALCGDCNLDTLFTILDALTAAQIAAGLVTPSADQFHRCNVQGLVAPSVGAVVDVLDSLALAQNAVGLPVTLHCC
jgi:hypothetical protein